MGLNEFMQGLIKGGTTNIIDDSVGQEVYDLLKQIGLQPNPDKIKVIDQDTVEVEMSHQEADILEGLDQQKFEVITSGGHFDITVTLVRI